MVHNLGLIFGDDLMFSVGYGRSEAERKNVLPKILVTTRARPVFMIADLYFSFSVLSGWYRKPTKTWQLTLRV